VFKNVGGRTIKIKLDSGGSYWGLGPKRTHERWEDVKDGQEPTGKFTKKGKPIMRDKYVKKCVDSWVTRTGKVGGAYDWKYEVTRAGNPSKKKGKKRVSLAAKAGKMMKKAMKGFK
jgi:hypothetical protein